jgi:hypothetical protein
VRLRDFPPETQHAALIEAIRHEYRCSLYKTAKDLCGYSDMTLRTHGDMIEALEDPATSRKLIVMPRGTFKSSVGVVAYCVWSLIQNPDDRILIDSEVYSNSKNFLREIKAHLKSERVTKLFGDFEGPTWSEGEITIAQRTRPFKEASITCGGIETVKVGQHYTKIICDDLNSGNNSATPEARRKVIQHYQMNVAILEPLGEMVVIGTRYAVDDIIGWILQNEVNEKPEGLLKPWMTNR